MREVPISCWFLAFPSLRDKALALGNGLRYFARVFNGPNALVMSGRDKSATWRSLGTHCRECDWSRPRAICELQNGLPYRTIPPGHVVDWHDPDVELSLDVEASTVTLMLGTVMAEGETCFVLGFDTPTVGIEVLSPTDAEVPSPPADAPKATTVRASAQWAIATTRNLRTENKIPEGVKKKAELARLLAVESQKAVKAGQIRRALKASYLEDQLVPWGIWPLSSFE
jgi:hypothetical protein